VGKRPDGRRVGRGTFLKGAGAALVLVAGGGVWRANERGVFGSGDSRAFEPWREWRAEGTEGPLALVPAAILASNAHNTQPWIFRVEDSRIDLFADGDRDIGAVDPFSREMYISLGCALENLLIAACAGGYRYRLALAPDPEDRTHAARVELLPGAKETSPLYGEIPNRHTNRRPYDDSRPISRATLDALGALNDGRDVGVFWFASRGERDKVGGLLADAARAINADEEQSYDNGLRWLRQDGDAVERHRDGLILDTMGLSGPALLAAKMLPDPSRKSSGEAWISLLRGQASSAGAFGVLAIRDYHGDAQRIRVGRLWQRMHLWITARGLAAQPMNQLHERADREAQLGLEPRFGDALKTLVGAPGWQATFTFRVGHPTGPAPPSPRRSAREVL
jgi:hypothetical protein